MRWAAIVLVLAAGALGCGEKENSRRARLWTLFDLARIAETQTAVAVGAAGFPDGIPLDYFLSPGPDTPAGAPGKQLTVSTGFVDGQVMYYVTTELWSGFDRVWVQPLYRALTPDGKVDDPEQAEPWVFGVGPQSLFYSPFWEVYGFHAPDGVDVRTLLDTRAVLQAANATGGLRKLDRRITTLAPTTVVPHPDWMENNYFDDTAAWDGAGGGRYLDFGTGRFDVDTDGVVREFPIFMFARRDDDGELRPVTGWPTVGGTRSLFSGAPVPNAGGSGAGGAGGASPAPSPNPSAADFGEPRFGGLWRMYTVEVSARAVLTPEGRVLADSRCTEQGVPCVVLDSQRAVETLGPERIRRSELLATCPMLALGSALFPTIPIEPPRAPQSP
ncbi:MAG: hypothetical protein ABUS79_20220 [Pseudomonadota bacterium]